MRRQKALLVRELKTAAARGRQLGEVERRQARPGRLGGISHGFLAGFLEGLGTTAAVAVLEPQPGACCVELRSAGVS
jgi:hypothetical protein